MSISTVKLFARNSIVHGSTQSIPFKRVEQTILKYTLDNEDSDMFVLLFTPLIQDHVSFEFTMCELIDRYKNPPAANEQSLGTILSRGERWLFERARHEVSVIPGNYQASLLQFDSQDMGEVSQNLTCNFCHREETQLPKLKLPVVLFMEKPASISLALSRQMQR